VLGQGGTTAEACRRIAVSKRTCYRWRKEYGGPKTDQARRMKDLEKENLRLRRAISDLTLDKPILQEAARGNFRAPRGAGACIDQVKEVLDVSERRVCRVLGQHRSAQRKVPCGADDEQALSEDIVVLAGQYGRSAIAG
jgi:putative transposase